MPFAADIFVEVFRAIWANKLRSFLTMFGIAWGIGSLLLLIGLGEGFRSGQMRQMATFGNDLILMWGGTAPAVPSQHTGMRPYTLTLADEDAIRSEAHQIRDVTAVLWRTTVNEVSDYAGSSSGVGGVEPNYRLLNFLPIAQGRFFNSEDLEQRRRVAVLGQKTAELLFPGRPALEDWILLDGFRFQVIGVAGSISHGNNDADNQNVYIPLSTMIELFPLAGATVPLDAVSSIQYQPLTKEGNDSAKAEVHRIIARRHGFDSTSVDAFTEWDTVASARAVSVIFNMMDWFLGGVGVVTLALGAVGVVNIMLVTVAERTREIGLRKALGATNRSILAQFLIEGVALTGLSGSIGIAGAALLMFLLKISPWHTQGFDSPHLTPWSAILALSCLCVCGMVAGVYPAQQAANLDPIEALRRE